MKTRRLALLTVALFLFLSAVGAATDVGAAAEPIEMRVSHPPGTYIQDIWLHIEPIEAASNGHEHGSTDQSTEYMYRFHQGPWTRVQGPLLLSAAAGEVRQHLIEVAPAGRLDSTESAPQDSVLLEYHIHKRSPATPRPLAAPGLYTDTVQLEFSDADTTRITYSIDGVTAVYDGRPVSITVEEGGYRRAELITQSIDNYGRVSEPGVFTYIIDRRNKVTEHQIIGDLPVPDLSLFSSPWHTPELATTENDTRKLIVAKAPTGTRLRYTLDGTEPSSSSDLAPDSGYFTTAAPTTRFQVELSPLRVRVEAPDGQLGPEKQLPLPGPRPARPTVMEDRSQPGVLVLTPEAPTDSPSAEFRFELRSDGEPAPAAGIHSPRLLPGTRIFVAPGETRNISYNVVRVNKDGGISEALLRAPAELSYPVPSAPTISIAPDGMVEIRGSGRLFYQVEAPEEGVLDSQEGWFQYDGQFRLPAIDGRRTQFRLKSYAKNDLGIRSALSSSEANIDLRQPDPRLLEDLRPVERPYPGAATLRFTSYDPELQVRYEVYENGASAPQRTGLASPGGELVLSGPSSPQRIEYSVRLTAFYPDSTREPFRAWKIVVIDSRPPDAPQVTGIEEDSLYFGVVRPDVRPASGEYVSVSLHRATPDGSEEPVSVLLPHEAISVERFGSGHFVLQIESGTASGITEHQERINFELQDHPQPRLQPKATVAHAPSTTAVFLSHGHGQRIAYALDFSDSSAQPDSLELREYITPLQLPGRPDAVPDRAAPDSDQALPKRIVFTLIPHEHEALEITTADWPHTAQPSFPELHDDGLYNHEIVLDRSTLNQPSLQLRFELTTGQAVPPVSPVSPVLGSSLGIDPGVDAEHEYQLRAAWFYGVTQVSPELKLSFAIDRIPPEAPAVLGVENEAHLDGGVGVSFSTADSSDQVLYRVVEDTELLSSPPEIDPETELTLHDGEEIPFEIGSGAYRAITLEAFSRDEAGNLSRDSTTVRFVLDRAVVYVDANTSTPDADRSGGRQTPYTELLPAFELAMADSRTLIQLGGGEYELTRRLSLATTENSPQALRIEGLSAGDGRLAGAGLSDAGGSSRQQMPTIRVSPSGGFDIQDLPLTLANLTLEAALGLESALLRLTQASSDLVLRNMELHLSGAAQALSVSDGTAQVKNSTFHGRDLNAGPLLRLSGGETLLHATSFNLAASAGTYRAIDIGAAARLTAEGLHMTGRPRAGLFTALHSAGDVDIRDSHFDLSGGQGLIALRATDGVLGLHSSEFELYGAAEFAYGLFLGASEAHATAVHVRVAGSLDDAAVVLERGELSLRNSRLELAEARGRSTAFRLSGGRSALASVDLVYHRIAAPGRFQARPDEETAVAIDAAARDALSFEGLRIAGFPTLLRPPRIPGVLRAPAPIRSPEEFTAYFGTERALNLQVYEDSSQISW
ncbi:MAG: hypothetical protein EA428_12830 [Spirochaetaceae bacterium]|nr:MAG: hypothetical protein EA428_12830 [Spirochaetaceae bacterium]